MLYRPVLMLFQKVATSGASGMIAASPTMAMGSGRYSVIVPSTGWWSRGPLAARAGGHAGWWSLGLIVGAAMVDAVGDAVHVGHQPGLRSPDLAEPKRVLEPGELDTWRLCPLGRSAAEIAQGVH